MVKKNQILIVLITLMSCQSRQEKFLNDFSTELLVTINPFETDKVTFDYTLKNYSNKNFIYIGKLKDSYLAKHKNFNKNQFHIQLDDKIGGIDNLQRFILTCNSNISKQLVFIHADKDTPKEFLTRVESEFFECGISKQQIYYLTINLNELKSGYNQNY